MAQWGIGARDIYRKALEKAADSNEAQAGFSYAPGNTRAQWIEQGLVSSGIPVDNLSAPAPAQRVQSNSSLQGLQSAVAPAGEVATQSLSPAAPQSGGPYGGFVPPASQPAPNVAPPAPAGDPTSGMSAGGSMVRSPQTTQAPQTTQTPQHPYMAPSLSPRMRRRQGRAGRGAGSLAGLQSVVK